MPEHGNSSPDKKRKVMILTHGLYPVPGYSVSGNGIRAWGLAMGLVYHGFEVIYATPADTVHPHAPRPEVTLTPFVDKAELHRLITLHEPDVLVVGYWAYMHLIPKDMDIPLVMDLLAPWLLETAFQETYDMELESIDYIKCLNRADFFLCCTQRQKAFHTAWLLMSGFSNKEIPLEVVPISTDPNLPTRPVLSSHDKTVFLYGGVLWPWRSPEAWITELMEILVETGSGELQLIAGKYPLHESSSSGALNLPQGPDYDAVLKQSDLLPYDKMEALYLTADVGIELSDRNLEREFSFSFRVIEYLRCGLPVICNDFLEVAGLIEAYDAGWVLDSNDDTAFEKVVRDILAGKGNLDTKRNNAERLVRERFNCLDTVAPLVNFCKHPVEYGKGDHFILSMIRHDGNVHALQTHITALSRQAEDATGLLDERQYHIEQLEKQLEYIKITHENILGLYEKKCEELTETCRNAETQLAVWKSIAEERRLIGRLRRLKSRLGSFIKLNKEERERPLLMEPDLYRATKQNMKLNLPQLFDALPLTPMQALLGGDQDLFDYQQQAVDRFLAKVDVSGKTVLEIGADNAVILRRFIDKGMAFGVGINNWYWSEEKQATYKITENIVLSWGDIRSLPFEDESFDLIFTVAAFEHIHELDVALNEMHRLLKPGGVVYSFYGPLWSCGMGHHLWFERDGRWFRFTDPDSTLPVLDSYEHLLLDRDAMAEKLSKTWDAKAVEDFLYQIYDTDLLNRYLYADYLSMFDCSEFEVLHIENVGSMSIEPEIENRLKERYGEANDFTCSTLEVLLKKTPRHDIQNESPQRRQPPTGSGKGIVNTVAQMGGRFRETSKQLYRALFHRLLMPLVQRWGKNNLAIVTREDVFPVDHGAAAKIYHTARVLSFEYDAVYLITLDREKFYVFNDGEMQEELYPRLFRELWYPTEGVLRDRLTAMGIPNKESFLFFPMLDPNFRLRVLYVALQKRISVYQAEFPAFIDACSWAYRLFGGIRSIVEHNLEYNRIADTYQLTDEVRDLMKAYEIELCHRVDHVITVSQNDGKGLVEAGVNEEKISMIPHGVDLEHFEYRGKDGVAARGAIREKYAISKDDIVLVFHGIYSYAPNGEAAQLIGSYILPTLNAKGYQPKCLAVGKYPPEESNHPDLIYTDVVPHVAPYINAADIAVVPLQDGGGTRMKILEYFAAGIPVVATSKGAEGIEVIPGKEIIIEDALDRLVDAVINLIEHPEQRRAIGDAGRKFVESLDWRQIGKSYVQLYEEAS